MTTSKKQSAGKSSKTNVSVRRKHLAKKRAVNKQPGLKWRILIIGLLILFSPLYYKFVSGGFSDAWHWIMDIGENPNYRHYKKFNIYVAEKYTIHGIDVSYAQGKIDWPKVKLMEENGLHISFAIIKATEGKDFTDSFFRRNWREAAKAGLVCGAYHYFRPETDGKDQAKFFVKSVKLEKGDMPLVVDVENLDGLTPIQMRESLNEFLDDVHYLTNTKPIIYSGLSFYQDYLEGYYNYYTLWIAHYNKPELKLKPASNWWFWQHSDKAKINGINHAVDFDTFKGDSVAFRELLIQ